MRRIMLAGLAAAVLPLAACDEPQQSETRSYEVTESVTAAAINSFGGTVTVTAGSGRDVVVFETLRYRGAKPAPEHRLEGTDLTFTSGCQGHRGDCGVDYRIEVPATVNVTVDSGGGAVSLDGLSGRLDVSSGGGAVDAVRVSAPAFTAATGGGAADVAFTAAPATVRIDSGGGDVKVGLPGGSYATDVDAEGGEAAVGVTTDPAAAHRIEVRTGGGNARLTS
ncbi:hypothetical protein AB0F81_03270 [Actinoplanes sp. NPDC024001]|uniref:hypothetical protein n=1 Tax=Actinoplanes sp. NPDC024001 TaxID=3154598 RepID=UPI00340C058D